MARRWYRSSGASLDGVIAKRLDADYLSAWYPRRPAERRTVLERAGKTTPFWMGTPGTP